MLKFSDIKPFPDISFWVEFAKVNYTNSCNLE